MNVDFGNETPMDSRCLESRETRHMIADLAATTRNRDYATQLYEEVLAEHPDDVEALVSLSYSSDDPGRALALVRRALEVHPAHPKAVDRVAELEAND